MKVLSWNVGGEHRFRGVKQDGYQYNEEDKAYFLECVVEVNPDMIGLQETHLPSDQDEVPFAQMLSEQCGYHRSEHYPYGGSHIKKENRLSLVNLSRYPIEKSSFFELPNPNLRHTRSNGDVWRSLDVGIAISHTSIGDREVVLLNTHLVAFHYLGRNAMEEEFQYVRDAIESYVLEHKDTPTVFMGDFNYPNLAEMLPRIFSEGKFTEVFTSAETAPGKGQQDHILLSKHWKFNGYEIRKLQADHYQCIADVDLL